MEQLSNPLTLMAEHWKGIVLLGIFLLIIWNDHRE